MPDNLPQDEHEAMLSAKAQASGDECDCFDHGWLAHRQFSPSQTPTEDALREATVERAAEAIARHAEPMHFRWSRLTPQQKGAYRDQARAALSSAGPSEQEKDADA